MTHTDYHSLHRCGHGKTCTEPVPPQRNLASPLGPTSATLKDLMVAFTTSRPSAALIPVQRLDHLQPPASPTSRKEREKWGTPI